MDNNFEVQSIALEAVSIIKRYCSVVETREHPNFLELTCGNVGVFKLKEFVTLEYQDGVAFVTYKESQYEIPFVENGKLNPNFEEALKRCWFYDNNNNYFLDI